MNKKCTSVTVKVTMEEKKRIMDEAGKNGMGASEYIREMVFRPGAMDDRLFARKAKPIIRDMQTRWNLVTAGIDVEKQKEEAWKGVESLCALLK